MSRFAVRLLLLTVLCGAIAAPAAALAAQQDPGPHRQVVAAQEAQPQDGGGNSGLGSAVIWSLVGIGIFAVALGAFYYFKRQVGGFPENPSWVAPITIMPSKDFPDEADFGEPATPGHGHAEH